MITLDIMEDNCLSFWSEDMIEGLADESQEKMVSLDKVCDILCEMLHEQDINDHTLVGAWEYDNAAEFVNVFREKFEE